MPVAIRRATASEVSKLAGSRISKPIDYNNVLHLSVRFSRESFGRFTEEATNEFIEDKFAGDGNAMRLRTSSEGSARSVLVSSAISRGLDRFACVAALANLVANGPYFSTAGLQTWATSRPSLYHRFVASHEPPLLTESGFQLQNLSLAATFQFFADMLLARKSAKYDQFTRGMAYFINGLKSESSNLLQIVWYLSAIEALLGAPNERLNQDQLIERLKIILKPERPDVMTGLFRETYSFRNKFLHGNINSGVWFGETDYFSHEGKNGSAIEFEGDHASFAKTVAHGILQRYVEGNLNELRFRLRLEAPQQ
ncbi:MAG: hypothetical protein R8G34_09215 [Paracoccaceae bacterium]|nr:hypothetical protein [Paracoccaceae bacterium]